MLSSLFRPHRRRPKLQADQTHSPYSSNYASPVAERHGTGYFRRYNSGGSVVESQAVEEDEHEHGEHDDDDDDEDAELTPLLPIFSAAHLDTLPVYSQTHALRAEIMSRCDTILTWEQLRTPQVSSFVVKPILANLMRGSESEKLSRGVIYSLMANCLQFRKEAEENPAVAGVSRTRALLAELLAIKILKEFSNRELIDALSYDFYPLQGMPPAMGSSTDPNPTPSSRVTPRAPPRASRISALEVAIRAQAKKFLSNALVVQHLDAIWRGNVVFHSAYDQMHRSGMPSPGEGSHFRRTATIYDGRSASLFKLSRLRVPRYKHVTGTISLAVLMLLHLLVLSQRCYGISTLEIVFWVWSLGFMMDEIAGFNEAGVSLYFMSLWNTFDMGIFILFTAFYVLRILGMVMPDGHRATTWSFDVLAAGAVFLYPRIFSVLDHFKYFSQLIIAFRVMALDMVALLVLIVIACSGFFVAFTFAFAREYYSASDVSYQLFQILLGFTPAAWDSWPKYNLLGKFLLVAFLIICHFLIVTILITVLTNSFAAVAANAQEEHQFLLAVNTISLVKNDSLFSYVAPTNLCAWLLHPFRWCIPFKKYVKLNRTVIKITHLPLLWAIFFFERSAMQGSIFETNEGFTGTRGGRTPTTIKEQLSNNELINPVVRRLRRDSFNSQQQERALDEVFRRPYRVATLKTDHGGNKVDSWMNGVLASPPTEMGDNGSRRISFRRGGFGRGDTYGTMMRRHKPLPRPPRDFSTARSFVSDPEDFTTNAGEPANFFTETEDDVTDARTEDDDADNEENSVDDEEDNNDDDEEEDNEDDEEDNDDEEDDLLVESAAEQGDNESTPKMRDFPTPPSKNGGASLSTGGSTLGKMKMASPAKSTLSQPARLPRRPGRHHTRQESSSTILFNPPPHADNASDDEVNSLLAPRKTGTRTPGAGSSGYKTPRPLKSAPQPQAAKEPAMLAPLASLAPRPGMPPRSAFQSVPNLSGLDRLLAAGGGGARKGGNTQQQHSRPSSDLGDYADEVNHFAEIPSSFATQMAMATKGLGASSSSDLMLNRMMLARMGALEDSFRDVKEILREVRRLRKKSERGSSEEATRGRRIAKD